MTEKNPFEDVDRAITEIIAKQLETVQELDGLEADVTPWEADFLESILVQLREKRALSQKQIEIVRRMCESYDVECDL